MGEIIWPMLQTTERDRNVPAGPAGTRFLRRREVLKRLGVSAVTLWRMVKSGRFPAPVPISAGIEAWRESDYEAWAQARAADRRHDD